MNVVQELQSLDVNEPGRWPLPFRVAAVVIVYVAVAVFGVWMLVVRNDMPLLERAQADEQTLRATFETRQRRAANFDAYRAQLAEMEQSFGTMLRQLPGSTEVPSLLLDISQTGLAAGLEENLFQPQAEIRRDFYAELPIRIRLTGSFHEFGNFVSGVAELSRIVTLHDVHIRRVDPNVYDRLTLDVTAKTYRYLDEDGAP